jgi:ribonucleoside-diphosphate reductase alpha chain
MRTRGKTLLGYTTSMGAPEGTTYVTVNSDQDGPLEVFVEVGRSGSDISALSEALGRLCSLVLRVPSAISPADRLGLMADQLLGLGGSTSVGFGPERVRSLPDAVGQVLANHDWAEYDTKEVRADYERLVEGTIPDEVAPPARAYKASGDLCQVCGSLMQRAEGCATCLSCGWSKC